MYGLPFYQGCAGTAMSEDKKILIIDPSVQETEKKEPEISEKEKKKRKRREFMEEKKRQLGEWRKAHPFRAVLRAVLSWVIPVVCVVFLAYGFSHFFCQTVQVQEGSMEPTLSTGDTLLVNELIPRLHPPRRFDIIVFRTGNETGASVHIKRVIGLPGETVQITGGAVYINGEKLDESAYGFDAILNGGLAEEQIVLDDDEFFVLGDNRNGSGDSRYTDIGNVERENIIGTVWFRVWPFPKTGKIR